MNVTLVSPRNRPFVLSPSYTPQPLFQAQNITYPSLQEESNVNVQQALILDDMFCVLLGHEGCYIRYSNQYCTASKAFHENPTLETLSGVLRGPDFKVSKSLNPSLKDLTKSTTRLGKICVSLGYFAAYLDSPWLGKTSQALAAFVRQTMIEYNQVIGQIYSRFQSSTFSASHAQYSILGLNDDIAATGIDVRLRVLHEICLMTHAETQKRVSRAGGLQGFLAGLRTEGALDTGVDSVKFRVCKGGLILKLVSDQAARNKGNAQVLDFLTRLFDAVAQDYILMLNEWLINGNVDDPFDEFLIKSNEQEDVDFDLEASLQNFSASFAHNRSVRRYWEAKYAVRKDGLPRQLEEKSIRDKILLTGTYLNILRDCGVLQKPMDLTIVPAPRFGETDHIIRSLTDIDRLNMDVAYWYSRADSQLIELLFEGYDLQAFIVGCRDLFFLHGPVCTGLTTLVASNMDWLRTHSKGLRAESAIAELKKQFGVFVKSDLIVVKLGSLQLEEKSIFHELQSILDVQPLNSERLLNSSSYQALTNIVQELAVPEQPSGGDRSHVSLDDYLVNHLTFGLEMPFPLNLVMNQTEMAKLQLIFRFLMAHLFVVSVLQENFLIIRNLSRLEGHEMARKLGFLNHSCLMTLNQVYGKYQEVIKAEYDKLMTGLRYGEGHSLTFEKVKGGLHNMLDNVLLYTQLSNKEYLRFMRGYFKRAVHFAKYIKLVLQESTEKEGKNGKLLDQFDEYCEKFKREFDVMRDKLKKFQ